MRVVTLATLATLPAARVLSRSLRAVHPEWRHDVLVAAAPEVLAAQGDASFAPLPAALRANLEELLANHDEDELATLLVPFLLEDAIGQGRGPVLHVPATSMVLGSLEPIERELGERGVLLSLRFRGELPDDGLEPTAETAETLGRVERTLIGVDGSDRSGFFLSWWSRRTTDALGSIDARRAGSRPEDRHWLGAFLELAPTLFDAAVPDDPGWNLSAWNLDAHTLVGEREAVLVDGAGPARLLQLPGFDPSRPPRLSPTATRARVSRSPILHELVGSYAEELLASGWRDPHHRAEVGRTLDGLVYDEQLAAVYGSALALGQPVADLFGRDGSAAFLDWLESPAPRGARHGINRYLFHRVARERPDVMRTYPDLDGEDGAGFIAWCSAFGHTELGLAERFLPGVARGRRRVPDSASSTATPQTANRHRAWRRPRPAREAPGALGDDGDGMHPAASEPPVVRLTGYMRHTLGLGAAARGYARALTAAGVPIATASVPLHHVEFPVALDAGYGRHGFEDLVHDDPAVEIIAVNPDELPDLVTRLGEDYFRAPRIGIWGWETNAVPRRWAGAFELVDEIWVYSRFMADNIGAVAPVPVVSLPPPVEVQLRTPQRAVRLGIPEGYLFLFVFDYMSTIQRKNPVGLIQAFKKAFPAGEGPQLLIKTINAPLRPLAEEEVLWAAHGRGDVHVIDRSLSSDELHGLMAEADCYVSLHRAEGFGLTMAEAMALGKPVVATGYSGNVDFMNDANSYLIDHTITLVGPECEIYPPEGEWAEPDLDHAARLMRQVYERREEAAAKGSRAALDIAEHLSAQATGAAMRARLEQLVAAPAAGRARLADVR